MQTFFQYEAYLFLYLYLVTTYLTQAVLHAIWTK